MAAFADNTILGTTKHYKGLFFDLDRTLWDVDRNQKKALQVIYDRYGLARHQPDFERCFTTYAQSNEQLWAAYRDGDVTREELRNRRFVETLAAMGVHDSRLARALSDAYVQLAPTFTAVMPHALEVVRALSQRYPMYILTNGFVETQHVKLSHCGLAPYFRHVICSEEAGANKPSPQIYRYALDKAGLRVEEAVMIGDDPESDLLGALRTGMDSIWFNPTAQPERVPVTKQIRSLDELLQIL